MDAHVNFQRETKPVNGLRSRKKADTRRRIEEVALALFAEQGYEATTVEQISDHAEISHTTFFRYFPSKAEVVMSRENDRLPKLRAEIERRPMSEDDLTAVRRAMEVVWLPAIDRDLTLITSQAVRKSATLRGVYEDITRGWAVAIAEALAVRRGLPHVDERCRLAARVIMGIFSASTETWLAGRCRAPLGEALGRNFDLVRLAD